MCSLAMDGRWVLYGVMGGKAVDGDLLGKLLFKRGYILSSLLRSRSLQVTLRIKTTFTLDLTNISCVVFCTISSVYSPYIIV